MSGTTLHGYPYPDPTDPLADGADAIKALAEAADLRVLPYVNVAAGPMSNLIAVLLRGVAVTANSGGQFAMDLSWGMVGNIQSASIMTQAYPVNCALVGVDAAAVTFAGYWGSNPGAGNSIGAAALNIWGVIIGDRKPGALSIPEGGVGFTPEDVIELPARSAGG